MRWLVTGATGFIGLTLAERLVAAGERVRVIVRDAGRARELAGMGAEVVRGDVSRPETLPEAVAGVETVVHLAGLVKAVTRQELFAVNEGGTRALARAAAQAGVRRFVLVSSLAAAGPSRPGRPRSEEDQPRPVSAYGESKLAAEVALRELAGELASSVVRPPIVYGPRDREFLPALFQMARARMVVKAGLGDKRYSIIHVDDLVDLILAAAERGARVEREGTAGVYFGDDGVEHTWEGLGMAALAALGRRGIVVPLPEAVSWVAAGASTAMARLTGKAAILSLDKMNEIREAAWTCTSARARRELGWRPRRSLVEGMKQSVKWYRDRGLV